MQECKKTTTLQSRERTILFVPKHGNLPTTSETRGLSFSIHLRLPLLVFSISCFKSAWFLPPLRPFLYSVCNFFIVFSYSSSFSSGPSLSSCDLILFDGGSRFLLEVTVRLTTGPPFSSVGRSRLKLLNEFLRDILHEPCS